MRQRPAHRPCRVFRRALTRLLWQGLRLVIKDCGPGYREFSGGLTGGFALGDQSKAAGGPLVILHAGDLI